MPGHDILVVGGGLSGLTVAALAARAGRKVLVVEREPRLGGALHTEQAEDGFWIELGAHTAYNSYGAFIELLEALGLMGELQPRGKPVLRFLDGERVLPGANLGGLLRRMSFWRMLGSLPRGLFSSPEGKTVRSYYGRFVGEQNYERVLGPMLSAVPSQKADDFPADMIFKKRPRRKDVLRSFTLRRGLGSVAAAVAALPGVTVVTGQAAVRLEREGAGYAVVLGDGTRAVAPAVALAAPPGATAALLAGVAPEAAAAARAVGEVAVETVGVVVRAERVALPYATFFIPLADTFRSVVTRDVVPHPTWRGFVFHFEPGRTEEEQLARITAVLGLPRAELAAIFRRRTVLPAPVLGHRETVRELDVHLAGTALAATGNWFTGLALEDCALRARAEWQRLEALAG
jgi:protoporphyrinogen/coproporphyrinogen III oxidase